MSKPVWWQYLLPQHVLSSFFGRLADCRCSRFKNFAIKQFARHYQVDLTEAEIERYQDFDSFNDFFTRKLKVAARPIACGGDSIVSPVDGTVSEMGHINEQTLLQAKGKGFSLSSLLANCTSWVEALMNGHFMTVYLSPSDYHRIHFPMDAEVTAMRYIPGKLFSVNQSAVARIDHLFARNERVAIQLETSVGPVVMVAVGAMVVGSIVADWQGVVNSPQYDKVFHWRYDKGAHVFQRGDELGHFKLGSTVILLFPANAVKWDPTLNVGSRVKMGQKIASRIGSEDCC